MKYCRHCNEKIINKEDQWVQMPLKHNVERMGNRLICRSSLDRSHEPR